MATIFDKYLASAGIGAKAAIATGKASDAVYVGALSAWIEAVTGAQPIVNDLKQPGHVYLTLTPLQNKRMQVWLEDQVIKSTKPSDSKVHVELAPALKPVAFKYGLPIFALTLATGILIGTFIK